MRRRAQVAEPDAVPESGSQARRHGCPQEHARREAGLGPEELRRALDYAEANLGGGLRLEGWAAELGLSTAAFARRFRVATGRTPYAWVLDRRIAKAKELLREADVPLADVALRIGYCSQSHFTEAFRRREGSTPATWRRLHQS